MNNYLLNVPKIHNYIQTIKKLWMIKNRQAITEIVPIASTKNLLFTVARKFKWNQTIKASFSISIRVIDPKKKNNNVLAEFEI